jgi:hypothetical protein
LIAFRSALSSIFVVFAILSFWRECPASLRLQVALRLNQSARLPAKIVDRSSSAPSKRKRRRPNRPSALCRLENRRSPPHFPPTDSPRITPRPNTCGYPTTGDTARRVDRGDRQRPDPPPEARLRQVAP